MKTINQTFKSEIEVKKSTFIAYLTPIAEFKSLHVKLKEEHPKARHIVWVVRYLNEYNQTVENLSDDGEPKGSSAPPILSVLRGEELIECGILVVRYFGGIKLGIGGLVRAYGSVAKEVIKSADLVKFVQKEPFFFSVCYHYLSRFEHYFSTKGIVPLKKEFEGNGVKFELQLSKEEKDEFLKFAKEYERDGFKLETSL